jgi:hypothetical protein
MARGERSLTRDEDAMEVRAMLLAQVKVAV